MAKMRSVSVPDTKVELWDKGVVIAGRRGISMSAFVLGCIEDELDRVGLAGNIQCPRCGQLHHQHGECPEAASVS